jgi:hypothetical protein
MNDFITRDIFIQDRPPGPVSSVEEDLVIYRLPGDKLGLGLRFEGGSKASEFVQRLFVQSCATDSPAAKTKCTWGFLAPGDEVISISGKIVRRMTRVDCVKALKGKWAKMPEVYSCQTGNERLSELKPRSKSYIRS